MRRRRQCANRSTAATTNGMSRPIRTSSIAQPRTTRSPTQTKLVVPWARSSPWSSEPISSCVAVPICGELRRVEVRRVVAERGGRPIAGGRDRDRRNAAGDERALLVEREGKREIDELVEEPGAANALAGLLEQPLGGGLDERRGRRAGLVAGDHEPGRSSTGDRVEVDHGDDAERRALGEARRAETAVRAAVGGEEDDGVRAAHPLLVGGRRAGVRARELDERGGARRVVVRAGPAAGVVAVGEDDDRVGRLARCDRPEVLEAELADPGHALGPRVRLDRQPVGPHRVAEPRLRPSGRRPFPEPGSDSSRRARRRAVSSRRRRRPAAAAAPEAAPAGRR